MKQRIVLNPITGKIVTTLPKYDPEIVLPRTIEFIKNNDCPFLERLALELDVTPKAMIDWTNDYPEFKELHTRLLTKQKLYLMEKGLSGETNVIMSIFQLKANHGMKDNPDENKDQAINVTNISYKDEEKKAKKQMKHIKHVTKPKKKVDKNNNEDS